MVEKEYNKGATVSFTAKLKLTGDQGQTVVVGTKACIEKAVKKDLKAIEALAKATVLSKDLGKGINILAGSLLITDTKYY